VQGFGRTLADRALLGADDCPHDLRQPKQLLLLEAATDELHSDGCSGQSFWVVEVSDLDVHFGARNGGGVELVQGGVDVSERNGDRRDVQKVVHARVRKMARKGRLQQAESVGVEGLHGGG
jgi:hypothetical protein